MFQNVLMYPKVSKPFDFKKCILESLCHFKNK